MKLAYLPLLAGLSPYCNRTATGLVQASTQRTKVVSNIAENPINKPNIRTHQDGLVRVTSDCGYREKVAGSSPVGHPLCCR